MKPFQLIENADTPFPLGAARTDQGMHFGLVSEGKECGVRIYKKGREESVHTILFPEKNRWGNLHYMTLGDNNWEDYEYEFVIDGMPVADPYGRNFTHREVWGRLEQIDLPMRTRFYFDTFDWEGDRPLEHPYYDMVIYHLHVRGFTKHTSSKVKEKGTFHGLIEKIPYLTELGITAVELMPVMEFCEVMVSPGGGPEQTAPKATGRLNYWGYQPACWFAPKASYTSGRGNQPEKEFKEMVKAFHKAGIEVILEIFPPAKTMELLDCLRFWVIEYHIDGFRLAGSVDQASLAEDPVLSRTKLLADHWDGIAKGGRRHLAEYNDGFQNDIRRYLKGDEDLLNSLIFRTARNPEDYAVINFLANTNGFTLMDLVSYDRKHNEDNGEENRDGNPHNYSWNCGAEGKSRSKKILALRRKQIRNAFVMLLLSQGTPLILAGDEFGNSQNGNNNAYCQDNAISWLNWNLLDRNQDIFQFVKELLAFRAKHKIFHMEKGLRMMEANSRGLPDVSYHGTSAWRPELDAYSRQIGMLYCGPNGSGNEDSYFYVAYNMHWENYTFALPNLPKGQKWHLVINSESGKIDEDGQGLLLKEQKRCKVPPRTIWVLAGR